MNYEWLLKNLQKCIFTILKNKKLNRSSFLASINDSKSLLEKIWLCQIYLGPKEVSDEFKGAINKQMEYSDVYSIWIKNQDYTFLLEDSSFIHLQFINNEKVNYSFYQNPQISKDYFTFLIDEWLVFDGEETSINWYECYDLYQHYLDTAGINKACLSIRYDLEFKQYKYLIHPCSHIHIWYNNDLRIPCSFIIKPIDFIIFIIKNIYPAIWKKELWILEPLLVRFSSKEDLPLSKFCTNEKHEIHLN